MCVVGPLQEEPKSVKEAMSSSQSNQWMMVMMEEIESINSNETWDLVDLREGRRAVGFKWVFKLKQNQIAEVIRSQARLVAQGFSQRYGSDYDEVFAPVVGQTTFRTLMSLAAYRKMVVKQYHVKTAFLHGNLEEETFMRQPPGFAVASMENKVYRLKKNLYGLNDSASHPDIAAARGIVVFKKC